MGLIWLTENSTTFQRTDLGVYNQDVSIPGASSGTTSFVADPVAAIQPVGRSDQVGELFAPNAVSSIADYLAKPYQVFQGSFTVVDSIGAILYVADTFTYYTNVLKINKLRGFYGLRATLCVRLDLNGTPYHAGRLRLCYYPCYTENQRKGSAHIQNVISLSQLPGVDIEANETSVLLRIPYVATTHFIELSAVPIDWGRIFVSVISPLRTGPDNQQQINYRVWTWMEDVELFGQTVTAVTQGPKRQRRQAPSDVESKPVSTFFSELSSFAGKITGIPIIGAYAGTVAWASAALSGAASAFGWSKPTETSALSRVYHNPAQVFPNFNATDPGIPMSLDSSAKLKAIDDFSPDGHDEMSISFIKNQYSYLDFFLFSTTNPAGAQIYTRSLTPVDFQNVVSPTEVYKTPVSYLAEVFRFYRGGIDWMLKSAKTGFHRGQIAVTYVPGPCATTITLDDTSFAYREIYDLSTGNIIKVETPWMIPLDYLRTDTAFGRIFVHVVTPLQAPETVGTDVYFSVYVKGANDLEFAGPVEPRYIPCFTQGPDGPRVDKTQEEAVNQPIGGVPVHPLGLVASQNAMSEIVLSISSLLKRHVHFGAPVSSASLMTRFYPWVLDAEYTVASTNAFRSKYQSYLLSPFAFMRGSVRLSTKTADTFVAEPTLAERLRDMNAYTSYGAGDPVFTAVPVQPAPTTGTRGCLAYTHSSRENGVLSVQVPYQCTTRVTPIRYHKDLTDVPEYNAPMPKITISTPSGTGGFTRAFGDDFQALFFVGIPRLAVRAD